ncbi:unnamed protein product [Effrenium voratum]|uniref:Uncharacterized protein n=1 Tax=Effrenium voratum TaxID=2562239 RepID=A0AA36N5B3_9DINO|nr:unnamed protein product [Effrenium voratum]
MAWRAVGFAYLSLLGASGEECDVVLLQLAHDLDNTSASTKTLAPNPKEVSPRAAWLRHAVTMLKGPARHGDAMLLGSRSKLAIHAHPLGELFGVSGVALAASSVNLVDVVWLLPFLIIARGTLHAGIFIFISQLWVTLAIIAWSLGGGVLESQPGMERDADYILGSLILLYAVVMYVQEKHADVDCDYESRFTTGTFILLTLAGTVDQILVYGPLLATELFRFTPRPPVGHLDGLLDHPGPRPLDGEKLLHPICRQGAAAVAAIDLHGSRRDGGGDARHHDGIRFS